MAGNGGILASSALSAGASLLGGASGNKSSATEAGLLRAQGKQAMIESQFAAAQKAREVTKFQSMQAMQYASSGVTGQGTPALVMEDTRQQGQQEVDALIQHGQAIQNLYNMKASITAKSGRSSFLSGIMGALTTGFKGFSMAQKSGLAGNNYSNPYGAGNAYYDTASTSVSDTGYISGTTW